MQIFLWAGRDTGSSVPKVAKRHVLSEKRTLVLFIHGMIQVVLIHGLTIPAVTWKDIAPHLAVKGFQILVYGELSSFGTPALYQS